MHSKQLANHFVPGIAFQEHRAEQSPNQCTGTFCRQHIPNLMKRRAAVARKRLASRSDDVYRSSLDQDTHTIESCAEISVLIVARLRGRRLSRGVSRWYLRGCVAAATPPLACRYIKGAYQYHSNLHVPTTLACDCQVWAPLLSRGLSRPPIHSKTAIGSELSCPRRCYVLSL